ncbi:MAG: DUF4135 domain-containing protein [Clostridia bacterium]|nr:DUF4135 domain-containing protein [Clostridia bacterium]
MKGSAGKIMMEQDHAFERLLRERFERHRWEMARYFFQGVDPAEIKGISETGDRHLHGEAVLRLDTAAGTVYYKPRDGAGTELLGQLNEMLFGERLVPEQISGRGYAFQKETAQRIPTEGAERAAFYTWLGRLTAVFYALGSTDMHRFNIIPAGDRPCVIDTETLLCARAAGFGGAGDFPADYGEIFPEYRMSVGECMVLPRFYAQIQKSPLLQGDDCTPRGYENSFLAGFQTGYQAILKKRAEVSALLDQFGHFSVRYIMRSTGAYNILIAAYASARSDAEKKSVLKRLENGLDSDQRRRWHPILAWEASCVKEGDVPYFWFCAGDRALRGDRQGNCLIEDFLRVSPIAYAKERIQSMNERDLAVQRDYILASLRHIDGWTDPSAQFLRAPVIEPTSLPEPLPKELAAQESAQALRAVWEERIPLSGGRCLWHVPMIDGKTGSLFGLARGFSGVGVFCRAASRSALLRETDKALALELAEACRRDMLAFGAYLLNEYSCPPEERVIARRFDGGFEFEDGLAGLLWALEYCRDADDRESAQLLEAFKHWPIGEQPEKMWETVWGTADRSWPDTDVLSGGLAGRAAACLSAHQQGEPGALNRAGRLLAWMVDRKKKNGVYMVFREGRQQYFLPAFLRGGLGIAGVMLSYAELS